jgi:GNAT superfamily N-acetyltransferase
LKVLRNSSPNATISTYSQISILDVTSMNGGIMAPEWLTKAEAVHRQLRQDLPKDYTEKMRRVFADGGRMSVANHEGEVVGVAVYRIYENTFDGVQMYVDDLVTDETKRSFGVGRALLNHLQIVAKEQGCEQFRLDSGTHRQQAHKFYFREGMTIKAFHFTKDVEKKSEGK